MTNEYIDTIIAGLRHCGSDEFCDNCPAGELRRTAPGAHICNCAAELIEELRGKRGRWMLSAHDERVNYRWHVDIECSECGYMRKEIWAGFFPGVPYSIAHDVALQDAKQVKLSAYCPNCGARMDLEE